MSPRRRSLGAIGAAALALAACASGGVPVAAGSPLQPTTAHSPPPSPAKITTTPSPATPPPGTTRPWALDFTGPAGTAPDPQLFTARTGGNGWGNRELESYTARPVNAALDGHGHLALHAVREQYTGADGIRRSWTSARLDSAATWAFTTGTLAIRMKVPHAAGMWPAFWLLGADERSVGWPRCGEIDIVELLGGHSVALQSVHGPDSAQYGYALTNSFTQHPTGDGYHVYSVTRRHGSIAFAVDGWTTATLTPAGLKPGQRWVFDKPMYLLLDLAVGGWAGAPTAATPARDTLLVDRIWFHPNP